jgi:hypothetical protein
MRVKPWLKEQWVLPPIQNAEFVCAMEDTLEVYQRPYDPQRPQVCLDESSKQLIDHVRPALPPQSGHSAREDYEYQRNGTASIFMISEPLAGRRKVHVTERRTSVDFAYVIRDLVDVQYPLAKKIVLVMDNLNTHKGASVYEAFPPEEARRILDRLEIHHTPKHGSWLNMAEIELSVLSRQCLNRRIPDRQTLTSEVTAWESARNADTCKIN